MSVSNPTLATPPVKQASEAAISSASFSVAAGSLIMVAVSLGTNSSAGATSYTIADTMGGLVWLQVHVANGAVGNLSLVALFFAVSNGNTGTVTVTPSPTGAASSGMELGVYAMSGQASLPTNWGTATANTTATLPVAPAATSLVVAFEAAILGSDPAQAQPAGYTGLITDDHAGTFLYTTLGYDNGSAAQSATFGGSAANNAVIIVEIPAATTATNLFTVQAFFGGTVGGTPTWTDITRFVRGPINVNKWRQDEQSQVQPSICTLTLDNDALAGDPTAPNAGRFTPGLTTSPFYPYVVPGVRIQVIVNLGGLSFNRFDGYVTDWDASYTGGDFGVCAVSASDILALWGNELLNAIAVEEVLLDHPNSLYPLLEADGASSAGDITNSKPTATIGTSKYGAGSYAFGVATSLAGVATGLTLSSPDAGAATSVPRGNYLTVPNALPASGAFTVEFCFLGPPNPPANLEQLFNLPAGDSYGSLNMQGFIDTALGVAALHINVAGAAATLAVSSDPTDVCDSKWHHVAAVLAADGKSLTVYLDGVALTPATNATNIGWTNPGKPLTFGMRAATVGVTAPLTGGLAMIAQYPAALTAARVLDHYQAAKTVFAGESTSVHMARLLSYRANNGSTLDTGRGAVGPHDTARVSLQQAVLDTGKAEGGIAYIDGQGQLALRNRGRIYDPAVAMTLDIGAEQTTPDLDWRVNNAGLVNDATLSRPNGAEQRQVNQASVAAYGTYATSDTLILNSDRDVADAAGWLVAENKDPRLQSPTVACDLLTEPSTALAQAVLSRQPLDRITLVNPPASAPAIDVIVQGCVDTIGVDVLTVSFNTTPMPRTTLRADASPDTYTKLDNNLVVPW